MCPEPDIDAGTRTNVTNVKVQPVFNKRAFIPTPPRRQKTIHPQLDRGKQSMALIARATVQPRLPRSLTPRDDHRGICIMAKRNPARIYTSVRGAEPSTAVKQRFTMKTSKKDKRADHVTWALGLARPRLAFARRALDEQRPGLGVGNELAKNLQVSLVGQGGLE